MLCEQIRISWLCEDYAMTHRSDEPLPLLQNNGLNPGLSSIPPSQISPLLKELESSYAQQSKSSSSQPQSTSTANLAPNQSVQNLYRPESRGREASLTQQQNALLQAQLNANLPAAQPPQTYGGNPSQNSPYNNVQAINPYLNSLINGANSPGQGNPAGSSNSLTTGSGQNVQAGQPGGNNQAGNVNPNAASTNLSELFPNASSLGAYGNPLSTSALENLDPQSALQMAQLLSLQQQLQRQSNLNQGNSGNNRNDNSGNNNNDMQD